VTASLAKSRKPQKSNGEPAFLDNKNAFWDEFKAGLIATWILILMRWRMVRNSASRVAILGGGIVIFFGLLIAINLGFAVQLATRQGDSVLAIYSRTWIQSLELGTMSSIGALAVGGSLLVALFAPFTGTSTLALVPPEDLDAIRPPRTHRYFDSLVINAVSGIGLVQLLTLTAVTSLLTLDGDRFQSLLFTWALWVTIIALTTTVGWSLEYVIRRWGKRTRRILAGTVFVIVGSAVLLDDNRGATLFGIADFYTSLIRSGLTGWSLPLSIGILFNLVLAFALTIAGVSVARASLRYPVPSSKKNKTHARAHQDKTSPTLIAINMLLRAIIRTPECRRPMYAIVVVGLPAMVLIGLDENTAIAVSLAVPLAVALSWGVNIFALLGTGMPWLASQPKILPALFRAGYLAQVAVMALLLFLLWGAALASGKIVGDSGTIYLVSGLIASLLVASISMSFSVRHPRRSRLSGRGDSLVPPLTALGYLLKLVFIAAYPSIVFSLEISPTTLVLLLLGGVAFAFFWYVWTDYRWRDPRTKEKVVSEVGAQ